LFRRRPGCGNLPRAQAAPTARARSYWPMPSQLLLAGFPTAAIFAPRRSLTALIQRLGRPSMRFVAVKNQTQQDMLALHRVRSLLIRERAALMNQMRGLLAEYGIVIT